MTMRRYIVLDGFKYAVESDSFVRTWQRQMTLNINAVTTTSQFNDRGPGLRTWSITLLIADWALDSEVYIDGVIQSASDQITNLEHSYGKKATSLHFEDVLGSVFDPTISSGGVWFTKLTQIVPKYSTVQKPYITYQIELVERNVNAP